MIDKLSEDNGIFIEKFDNFDQNINVNDYIDIKSYTAQGRILDNKKRMSAFIFIDISSNDSNVSINEKINNSEPGNDELTLF